MSTSFAEIVRAVAAENPEVADYRVLSESMLEEIRGREAELLVKLLPGYMRVVLSRRLAGGSDEEAWEAFLDERIPTSDRGTVFVRDAIADDLTRAVERRRQHAGNLDRRAQQFEQVEKKMRETGAARVRDLAPAIGADALVDVENQIAVVRARRLTARRRASMLGSLTAVRDELRSWLATNDSPLVRELEVRRRLLVELIADRIWEERRGQVVTEVLKEFFHGKG